MDNQGSLLLLDQMGRKKFIRTTIQLAGGALLFSPVMAHAEMFKEKSMTVGEVMDLFISEIKNAPFEKTVDTLKSGNRDIVVTGIVTTMFATIDVIRKAIALKANFIIAHEPTFYNHADETGWLEKDEVFGYKMELLKKNNIAVWRNHDYVHSHRPDGVKYALVQDLGWSEKYDANTDIVQVEATSLKDLVAHLKTKLHIPTMRYIGELEQPCKKILLMPGAAGGRRQIDLLIRTKPDVIVCGEIQEWETAEYVRDARAKGEQLSLVVLGHIASEEPGSRYMAEWLTKKIPAIKTKHIPAKHSLSFI
ncbi:MAG: Nif3-like dinuclear metal center hexameric protein [Ferruginibacter sp.]|nr:Nif3-like dinuclear metal center hexameric protein [Ferruginibacter sp.]